MPSKTFEGKRESLADTRSWLRVSLSTIISDDAIDHSLVLISVGEILQNIIRYGFEANEIDGEISISIFSFPYGICIDIEDTAPPSDSETWVVDKDISEGGLGLVAVANAVSSVTYTALNCGNRARLVFTVPVFQFSRESAAWVADIFVARQKPFALADYLATGMGKHLEPWHRNIFELTAKDVIEHVERCRSQLFYHNEWHVQDVVISITHLLRACKNLSPREIMESLLAAAFHDHLHPGMAALQKLEKSIEAVSAEAAKASLSNWLKANPTPVRLDLDAIHDLIVSTEPATRSRLGSLRNIEEDSLRLRKIVLNDADILVSFIPSLGSNLARSVKFEALLVDQKSADIYKRFADSMVLKSEQAIRLISPFQS